MIKNLSVKLKRLRQNNNLSQREVAEKLDLSPSIISGYETGERVPSAENLLALSYLYKCSTDYLLGKSNEPPLLVLDTNGMTVKQIQALQALIISIKHE